MELTFFENLNYKSTTLQQSNISNSLKVNSDRKNIPLTILKQNKTKIYTTLLT